jgi:hypothetical protein
MKILFAVHSKCSSFWPSAGVKCMHNDLVHSMPWQCMFALFMSLSLTRFLSLCLSLYPHFLSLSISLTHTHTFSLSLSLYIYIYIYTYIYMCVCVCVCVYCVIIFDGERYLCDVMSFSFNFINKINQPKPL